MKIRLHRTILGTAAAVALVVPSVMASSASAGASKPWAGPPSYVPILTAQHGVGRDTKFGNVDYNGGPLMASSTDYLVFWSPTGYSAYGSGSMPEYVTGLDQYWTDLADDSGGHQNVDSVSTQYNDLTGARSAYNVTFGGGILDTDPYPTSACPVNHPVTECMSDRQLQNEVEHFAKAHDLKRDLGHQFYLVTPPNVENCFNNNPSSNPPYGGCSAGEVPSNLGLYCAYHENTSLSPMALYSVDPYVTGIGGCDDGNHPNGPSDGALVGGMSHEHNESITDPMPNDAWTNGAGARHGEEIGDQCDGVMGTPLGTHNGAKYNQVINGHFYWYQEEWSNQGSTCLQRFTLSGAEPTATFTATKGTGLSMTFDATGSTAPGGVADYTWQFNDAFGASTVEQTTPKITHTFPAAGTFSIGLTVYAKNGTSAGAGALVTTGKSGFTPGFTYSPANPAAHQLITFTGLSTVSLKPVLTYLWEFGDGKTSTNVKTRHTYSKAGTYTVTLVMFSGTGSAYPGAGAGPVFTEKIKVS